MPESPRALDLRTLPPSERDEAVFRTFDALGPEETLVLVSDHDPASLVPRFQAERPGRFDWNVLEAEPERFRVEIRRRAVEGPYSTSEYLQQDHRRLDGIVTRARSLAADRSFDEAARRFAEFACGLNHHIDMEENILFPVVERVTGPAGGPTTVMRMEHADIRQRMALVASALRSQDPAAVDTILSLTQLLGSHNAKEEHMLYPMADHAAGGDRELEDLVRRLQACPAAKAA
jgi:uncharacterized protein (DUF2249 family)/hemerythrin-like domain-containing protein